MNRCEMLRELPGEAFDTAVAPYQQNFAPFLEAMRQTLDAGGPLARLEVFKNYERYCRWPIRMLEYGFAMASVGECGQGRALDVGSGVTPWAYWLAAQGWETTAVDLILEEVSAMSRHGADTYGQSVRHLMADGRGLAFANSQFDMVTCMSVIEHVPQWDTALMLAELVRVCRPGGRLVMTTDLLASDTPFTEAESFTVERFISRFALLAEACGAKEAFEQLTADVQSTTFADLAEFWTTHKTCGLWEEDNRGYHAVGLSFTLPESPDEKRRLSSSQPMARVLRFRFRTRHRSGCRPIPRWWTRCKAAPSNRMSTLSLRTTSGVETWFSMLVPTWGTIRVCWASVSSRPVKCTHSSRPRSRTSAWFATHSSMHPRSGATASHYRARAGHVRSILVPATTKHSTHSGSLLASASRKMASTQARPFG